MTRRMFFVGLNSPARMRTEMQARQAFAGGTVGDVLRTAEASLGKEVVHLRRPVADEMSEHLPLELAVDIGAG